jgi:hypothetical protein
MIHCKPTPGQYPADRVSGGDLSLYRECFTAVETLTSQVRTARRAADESLRRALDAPEPHETTNTVFVALWEAHLRDREMLFSTMRDLDDARAELRRMVARLGVGKHAAL